MGLYKTIKGRKPWFTFFFTILFGPVFGMLYINRGWFALIYLTIILGLYVALYMYFQQRLEKELFDAIDIGTSLGLYIVAALHASHIASNFNKYEDLRWFSRIMPPISIAFLSLIPILLVGRIFFYEPFHIPSSSMEPSFSSDDLIFVKKSSYGYSRYAFPLEFKLWDGRIYNTAPKRGDAVVFALPENPRIDYFKRVIGLPGDVVQMKQGELYINDKKVERKKIEPYLVRNAKLQDQYSETLPGGKTHNILSVSDTIPLDNTPPYTVPEHHYFMMGDNRDHSMDSRVFGAVHEDYFIGIASIQFRDGRTGSYTFRNVEDY